MKRAQMKRLVLFVIVLTTIFSFIPAAVAYSGRGKVNIRPIEDWLLPVVRHPMGGMPDLDKGLIIWTFLDDPTIPHWASALDYDPEGFVLERELKDNILLLTVNMRVKNAPFYITKLLDPMINPIFRGAMDFSYELKFTIDLDTLGPDDYDENGNIIYHPWNYYVWLGGGTFESVFLCGHGSGEFVNSYDGWEEGEIAKMHVISNFVRVGEDYTGPNPYYNFLGLLEIPLISKINFH